MLPKYKCGLVSLQGFPQQPVCFMPTFKKGWKEKQDKNKTNTQTKNKTKKKPVTITQNGALDRVSRDEETGGQLPSSHPEPHQEGESVPRPRIPAVSPESDSSRGQGPRQDPTTVISTTTGVCLSSRGVLANAKHHQEPSKARSSQSAFCVCC